MRVGVVGAGTMGTGIAFVCARRGHHVLLMDQNEGILERAKSDLQEMLERERQKDRITPQEQEQIEQSIEYVQELDVMAGQEIVIEAVSEEIDLKKRIFQQLAAICSESTLLLTNTSSLSITEIAAGCLHEERILGFHFFNPAPVMPLVEVVRGMKSSGTNIQRAVQFAKDLGKIPVVVENTPGFIVNRIARPYYNEALKILEERVTTFDQIDQILTKAGGFKMGPFALQDLIGIDINLATTQTVYTNFFQEDRFRPSRIQQQMVEAGRLGRKSGEGFYDYHK